MAADDVADGLSGEAPSRPQPVQCPIKPCKREAQMSDEQDRDHELAGDDRTEGERESAARAVDRGATPSGPRDHDPAGAIPCHSVRSRPHRDDAAIVPMSVARIATSEPYGVADRQQLAVVGASYQWSVGPCRQPGVRDSSTRTRCEAVGR
jgi:hypothetical protein